MILQVMRPSGDLNFAEKEQELAALTAPLLRLDLNSEIDRLQTDKHWLKDGRS